MSNKELIDEVLTLIVAGHETTAAALTWTWYLVSEHPEAAAMNTGAAQDLGLATQAVGTRDDFGTPLTLSVSISVESRPHRCRHCGVASPS